MILKHLKYLFLLLLTFLLGAQPNYAKTEVITPAHQKVFTQTATTQPSTLKKVAQPNVGFLKEKNRFVVVEGVSAQNQHFLSKYFVGSLANGGRKFTTSELALLKRADLPDFVSNNLDDLLLAENRTAIWNLNNVSSGQFKRGDLIEEIFNQWGNKYGGYQNLNDIIPNYRTLDFDGVLANVNEVVSLKTFKPVTNNTLSNFKTTLRNNTRKLNNDAAIGVNHTGKDRILDFTIENGVWTTNQLDDIDTYIDGLLNDFPNVTDIRISEF